MVYSEFIADGDPAVMQVVPSAEYLSKLFTLPSSLVKKSDTKDGNGNPSKP